MWGVLEVLLFLLLLGIVVERTRGGYGSNGYPYHLTPDPSYTMWWKFDDKYITIKVNAKTKGSVLWGLTTLSDDSHEMDGVIAWVDDSNGKHFLYDFHQENNSIPVIDQTQDYKLLKMAQTDKETTFTFRRKLLTQDKFDQPITAGTARIHWGWSKSDVQQNLEIFPKMYSSGVAYTYLVDYYHRWNTPLPKRYKTWIIRVPNYTVPANTSQYTYMYKKFPNIGKRKHQIIRVEQIVPPKSKFVVHHMMLYRTPGDVKEQDMGKVLNRGKTGELIHAMPRHWTHATVYPPFVGMPMESKDGKRLVLTLNVHYMNTGPSVVDSSGFRIYYTDEVRKYDAMVALMQNLNSLDIIPQKQSHFTSYSYCPSQCIQLEKKSKTEVVETLRDDGIIEDEHFKPQQWLSGFDVPQDMGTDTVTRPKILALNVHGHEHTKKTMVRLIDERTGEAKRTILFDPNFEYEYQGLHYLKEPIEIPPHHGLQVECTRNTMDRTTPLHGNEEMCNAFLGIYPRIKAPFCFTGSSNPYTWGHRHLGWKQEGHKLRAPVHVGNTTYKGRVLKPLLDAGFWEGKEDRVKIFEADGAVEPFMYSCGGLTGSTDKNLVKTLKHP